jgi:hypothetical protein
MIPPPPTSEALSLRAFTSFYELSLYPCREMGIMQRIIHRRKEHSMLRGLLTGIMMLACLTACAGEATATPTASLSPSPEAPATQTERPTVDYAQLTAFATYRPTLVPSFTPTFTPSASPIPSITPLPSPTNTREPMSELILCPGFDDSPFAPQGREIGVVFRIPQDLAIFIEIINADTMEVVDDTLLPNEESVTMVFDPAQMPAGNYIWRASLQDATRTGLCPREGTYTILAVPTPEATAELLEEATLATPATATRRPRESRATEEAGH